MCMHTIQQGNNDKGVEGTNVYDGMHSSSAAVGRDTRMKILENRGRNSARGGGTISAHGSTTFAHGDDDACGDDDDATPTVHSSSFHEDQDANMMNNKGHVGAAATHAECVVHHALSEVYAPNDKNPKKCTTVVNEDLHNGHQGQ
ncbi:hypothetical protein L2E82_35423 [Cichorium intybus]|uniref:Uncharacterized protein n=1 Tax=Cichorium intybus TaxID=13427 RepID=A0ACB9BP01_CICIN|nr:hypothetical protein L2E82_35423 [Cichorium intybus]